MDQSDFLCFVFSESAAAVVVAVVVVVVTVAVASQFYLSLFLDEYFKRPDHMS